MSSPNNYATGCRQYDLRNYLRVTLPFFIIPLFLLFSVMAMGQTNLIIGVVTDADGKPVEGATVSVRNTKVFVYAGKDGKFTIKAGKGDVLSITSVNFEARTYKIADESMINIRMDRVDGTLNDIIVIGYGTAKKKDVTGAVTQVNLAKVAETPLNSVDQILAGRAGGVQISQSNGQAGAGTSIRIRGGNSINGTNEPLFVVDGFPIINDNGAYAASGPLGLTNSGSGNSGQGNPNGALNWLNPADIASIEVLKDASATAIYGSRGANGVIIITTKKGKAGQSRVNFSSSYGFSQLNDSKIKLMDAKQFATYGNYLSKEQGEPVYYKDTTIKGILYPTPDKITTNTNWIDVISRKGRNQNYTLDFSGGKDIIYSGSIGWLGQETPLLGSQFKRANFRLNLQTNLTSWLSVDNSFSYSESTADNSPSDSRDVQKYGLFEAALVTNPAEPVYKPDGTLNYTGSRSYKSPALGFNPLAQATDVLNKNTVGTFLDNMSLKAKVLDGLTLEARGSIFKTDLLRDIYYNSKTVFIGEQVGGLAGKNTNNSVSYLAEGFATYSKYFGKNQFSAVGGYSYQTTTFRTLTIGASGFANDILKNENLSSAATQYPTQSNRVEDELESYYARINNIYNDKYIITLTGRYDGSTKFGPGNHWSFFPSGALSWRISQENFLKQAKAISDLKLRVSYGLTGNQAVASLQTKSLLGFTQYPYGGVLQTGVFPAVLGNQDLKWETTKQLNVGLDFGFWDQRLSGSINYYHKRTEDLLQYFALPQNSGYGAQLRNVGSISNRGVELELHGSIIRSKDFSWDINANIATNKQRVENLGRGNVDTLYAQFQVVGGSNANVVLIKGRPVGLFYGYLSDGIFRNAADLAKGPALPNSKVGTRKFKDRNKDGVISDRDRQVIGDPNPDFIFGFANNFSYKGLDLNFVFQGVVGGDRWNFTDYIQSRLGNRSQAANDYFTPTNTNAKYPAPGQTVGDDFHSDFTIESASYLRLKSLTLGYNIPVQSIKFVRSARLYVSGTNLLTFTKYSGYDPESNSFGQSNLFRNIDIMSIPLYRVYTVGLNVGF
jgi:TonB-dependent starch-binding outer membrane protein SusC